MHLNESVKKNKRLKYQQGLSFGKNRFQKLSKTLQIPFHEILTSVTNLNKQRTEIKSSLKPFQKLTSFKKNHSIL